VIHIVDRVLIIRKHRKATLGAVAQTVSILG
jgi:hypothetical protein